MKFTNPENYSKHMLEWWGKRLQRWEGLEDWKRVNIKGYHLSADGAWGNLIALIKIYLSEMRKEPFSVEKIDAMTDKSEKPLHITSTNHNINQITFLGLLDRWEMNKKHGTYLFSFRKEITDRGFDGMVWFLTKNKYIKHRFGQKGIIKNDSEELLKKAMGGV